MEILCLIFSSIERIFLNFRLLTSVVVLAIPHIPSASIVIVITVLHSAGVPTQAASLLYAVDWLL